MRKHLLVCILSAVGFPLALAAGPETYDPLAIYKKANTMSARPTRETVTEGTSVETAKFQYENSRLARADYFNAKNARTGYTQYTYDGDTLKSEQLFDGAGVLVESIEYQYRGAKLDKLLVSDIRGGAHIAWQYAYDKQGRLISGKRVLDKKVTESFKLVYGASRNTQNIYNAKGELTSKVESDFDKGVLRRRVKTGLTGARYAEYLYDAQNRLTEVIYHDTVHGEKKLVKKHQFDYSLKAEPSAATALRVDN